MNEDVELNHVMSHEDMRNSAHGGTHYSKHSAGGNGNNVLHGATTSHTRSLASLNHRSQRQIVLTDEMKVRVWREFQSDYYRECLQVFRAVKKQRTHVFEGLTQMQG